MHSFIIHLKYSFFIGISSDSSLLIDLARESALEHEYSFDESIPVQQLVIEVCEIKQNFTQFGGFLHLYISIPFLFFNQGLRPFGTSLLFGGWDEHFGFQMYLTGPSGNYMGWKATAAGRDSENIDKILKHRYSDSLSLDDSIQLALHAIATASPEGNDSVRSVSQLELTTITRDEKRKKGKQVVFHHYTTEEIKAFINSHSESVFLAENLADLSV